MITITIDDQQVEIPTGTTILNAARKAGIEIPTLCDHPHLTPFGGCRLCMVEINGYRTLQSACTMPAADKMVIHTDSEKIRAARKFVLTLIFSERNHFCPYCQVSGGDCDLQNAAYHEGMTHWDLQPGWHQYPVDASHPYIILEHNRCILCHRCVRACNELVGVNTLNIEERGTHSLVVADLNVPLGESTCASCGSCVQVCPTGAIIDRHSAYLGHDEDLEHHLSICTGCSIGCGIDVLTRNNQLIRIEGDWDSPVNGGILCKIGRFHPVHNQKERITSPMIRKEGNLVSTSWEEALKIVASKINSYSGVNTMVSDTLSAEALHYSKQLFKSGLGSTSVTSLNGGSNLQISRQFAAEHNGPFEAPLDALTIAESVLVYGADLVDDHEVAGFFIRRNLHNGINLIVASTKNLKLFDLANYGLIAKPGTEKHLLRGLSAAIKKLGQAQADLPGDANQMVLDAAESSGVPSSLLLEAAFKLSCSEKAVIVYAADQISDLEELNALTTLANIAGAKLISIKGAANSLTAALYDLQKPVDPSQNHPSYIILGDEEPDSRLIKAFERSPFLVVQASQSSPLTDMADVILPSASNFEQDGHYINLEGRIQRANKCLAAPGNAMDHATIIKSLAKQLHTQVDDDWKKELLSSPTPVAVIS